MKNLIKNAVFSPAILVFVLCCYSSCSDMTYQPEGDHVIGWIAFHDTNVVPGGYYAVSIYKNKANPFDTLPIRSDSLAMSDYGTYFQAKYRLDNVLPGDYFVAVTWIKSPVIPGLMPPVLGTLGCDTVHGCTDHEIVAFPNYTGKSYDFLSRVDTSQKLN